MVHDAWFDRAIGQCPIQCAERQFRAQILFELPAHHSSRIGVHHDRQIQKCLSQPHVGDVGHPELIDARELQPGSQVRVHRVSVPRIGGEDESLFAYGQQVVGAHQPQHAFAIGHDSLVPQLLSHTAVTVATILQHDLLDEVAQRDVRLARLVLFVLAVESSPAHARDLAGVARLEALKLHHVSDLCVDAVAPVPVLFRRNSLTRLKALRKKSRSRACCPILRSNSATRRAAASSGLATDRGGFGTPGGRPTARCKPAAPSLRYASRQRYNTLRLICSSWCSELTLSPFRIRCATLSLNSWPKTRFFPDTLDSFPFNEKCP